MAYAYFPADPRIRREVDALRGAGHDVDVICLRGEDEVGVESIGGARITRIPLRARRGGRLRYAFQYAVFFALSSLELFRLHRRNPVQIVHVHSLPDFQVFCATPLKFRGVRVILDLHEALPEIVAARFRPGIGRLLVRLAQIAERFSVLFADQVITVNDTIGQLVVQRARPRHDAVVVMNSPDLGVLRIGEVGALKRQLGLDSDPAIVYVGGINPERDLTTLLRAVSSLRDRRPIQVVIAGYGDPEYVRSLRETADKLPSAHPVLFLPRIPQEQVLTYVALSSLGVISYAESPLTEVAIPTKVFEYAATKKPMAIVRLRALVDLFGHAAEFFRPGDERDLASAIERILADPTRAEQLVDNALDILRKCSWEIMRRRLLSTYERLGGIAG
ncbi:MAG TPA: glycosyltransferase family 4 protein [Thermoplasmata archaeon]|nr:glycosyltransferase family 4 protein [Thermoplasmata archaeon]